MSTLLHLAALSLGTAIVLATVAAFAAAILLLIGIALYNTIDAAKCMWAWLMRGRA